jgi:crotonobetainyl-CoA:carnitine CoA-transferase CaiB-like acyl-CoA transferase
MSVTGEPDGRPLKVGVAVVDVLCGLHACVGVLAALHSRIATGKGQLVEVDLLSSALSALVNQAAGFLLAGAKPRAAGNAHPSVAPYETFAVADGSIAIAVGSDSQFSVLCSALQLGALNEDPRYATNAARVANRASLAGHIEKRLATLDRRAALTLLEAAGVPSGPVNKMDEAFAFADAIGLEPVWSRDGDDYVRAPFRLSGTPPEVRLSAPALDSAGEEIREWLRSPRACAVDRRLNDRR